MINFDDYANENKTEQFRVATYSRSSIQNINSRRLWIWENKCIIKCNIQSTTYCKKIKKIYLCAKDSYGAEHQYFINKREKVGLNRFNDPKAFMEYSEDMQDVYKNIEEYTSLTSF